MVPQPHLSLCCWTVPEDVEQWTAAHVAAFLDKIDLPDVKEYFRRTTGAHLARLSKDDLRRRLHEDPEAADILDAELEAYRRKLASSAQEVVLR